MVEKVLTSDGFESSSIDLFQLYLAPFLVMLILVNGMELFRRNVHQTLTKSFPLVLLSGGTVSSILITSIICPLGPGLFSLSVLIMIGGGLVISLIAGLIIGLLVRTSSKS